MKNKNISTLLLLAIIATLTSCLPQEKTTQCGPNEAFNATQRKCVTTQTNSTDSISIANVTPSSSYSVSISDPSRTHAVTVSDPFNIGSSIRWNVTNPGGSTSLVSLGTTYTFNHTILPMGSYVIEVQVLNTAGTEILDSRSWTVNIIAQSAPSITSSTSTPFSTTISSAPTTIMATANNPDLISNVNYQWFVNGVAVLGQSGVFSTASQTVDFIFNPTSSSTYFVGAGVYSVQLSLTENGTGNVYSSSIWSISNNIPGFTSVSLGSANSGTATGNATPTPASIITALDAVPLGAGGFKIDLDADGDLDDIDFCVQAADVSGVDGNGVFVDFLQNGNAIAGGSGLQLLLDDTPVCLGDGLAVGFNIDIPANLAIESHAITAVVYDGFAGSSSNPSYNGATELTRYNWTTRARQLNTAPAITIDSTNTNFPGTCTTSGASVMSGCTVTQDQDFTIAINVTDDDFDPNDFTDEFQFFNVQFFLDGRLLDGSDSLSAADCFEDFGETNNSNRYICTMRINSFDTGGPIDPAGNSHTLTAVVFDSQSPFTIAQSPLSNTVSWLISTVLPDVDTGASIVAFDETTAIAPTATESFVATQASPNLAINLNANSVAPQITEGDNIVFNVSVDDIERDSHFITIFRCNDKTTSCTSPEVIATHSVISTDDSNPKRTPITAPVTEDSVVGAIQDTVFYRVVVRKDNSIGAPDLDSVVFTTLVANNNPDPVFDTANFNPALNPSPALPLIAYTGLPLTITPGSITDPSLADGTNITYQWMVAIDSNNDGDTSDETYAAIPSATTKDLVWTPGSEIDFALQIGTAVTLKLCIGDDGWDNAANAPKNPLNIAGDDCLNASLDSGEWFVTSFSNMQIGSSATANTSTGEIAVWVDQSETTALVKYMAYATIGNQIVVEKIVTLNNGGKGGSIAQTSPEISSIVFDATALPDIPGEITNLTIAGDSTNKALYIAYMSPALGVNNMVHVRRIDISGGKTNPALLHDGKFSWDNGYNDLTDNTTLGPGLTQLVDSFGQLQITVTGDANATPTMSLQVSGLHGFTPSTLTAGAEFCNPVSLCSDITTTASALADAINDSILPNFQGLTATASSGIITLDGVTANDFLLENIGATSIGSLMINKNAGQWQLPFINNNLGPSDQSKISVLHGPLGSDLLPSVGANHFLLGDTTPSQEIVNAIYKSDKNADTILEGNDQILIATRSLGTAEITLFEYDFAYNLGDSTLDLFNDNDISDIKIAISQNTANPAAYVLGRNFANAFAYARVNHTSGDFDFGTTFIALDLDNDFELIENNNATHFQLAAGPLNNQVFMAVTDSLNQDSYLLNITGSLPSIDCSFDQDQDITKCMKLITNTSDTTFALPIALSDVVEDVTLASDGATVGEGQSDIIVIGYHVDNGGGDPLLDALPVMGVLNAAAVNLSGDETAPGLRYNIPYIND